MALKIFWLTNAEEKLNVIFKYYAENVNQGVAEKVIHGIIESTLVLTHTPESGQIETLLTHKPQEIRYLVHKNYKVVYFKNTAKNRVDILTVFDCRQSPEKLIELI